MTGTSMQKQAKYDPNAKHWYAATIRAGQWKKTGQRLTELGVEYYVPDAFKTLLFVNTDKQNALTIVNSGAVSARYFIDHGTHSLLIVPEKQMEDFRRVMDLSPDAECLSAMPLVKGARVRVIKGALSGVEGDIVEAPEGQYLVVSVMSLMCAKVEMPKSHVVAI